MQCQFSSQSGMSALTLCANKVPDNSSFELQTSSAVDVVQLHKDDNDDKHFIQDSRHHLGMLKKHQQPQTAHLQMAEWCNTGSGVPPL
eukprot:8302666-Ditylum_brightwellii.AAC.1